MVSSTTKDSPSGAQQSRGIQDRAFRHHPIRPSAWPTLFHPGLVAAEVVTERRLIRAPVGRPVLCPATAGGRHRGGRFSPSWSPTSGVPSADAGSSSWHPDWRTLGPVDVDHSSDAGACCCLRRGGRQQPSHDGDQNRHVEHTNRCGGPAASAGRADGLISKVPRAPSPVEIQLTFTTVGRNRPKRGVRMTRACERALRPVGRRSSVDQG